MNTKKPNNACADFETAISKTGYGLFHVLLCLSAVPEVFSVMFESTTLAYVFPIAACDLDLSLQDRGVINASNLIGMISSSFIWGAVADIFGRRKIIIISEFSYIVTVFITTFAPNYTALVIAKFLGGFMVNGVSVVLSTYLSEFHASAYRSRVPLLLGFIFSFAGICLPLLAWLILPLPIGDTNSMFQSWNLYLILTIVPPLLGGTALFFFPESPKYLMSKNDNERALEIFRTIFALNKGKAKMDYPVTQLEVQNEIQRRFSLKSTWRQLSPLFSRRLLLKLILVSVIISSIMLCVNTLRLWLPELFQIANDFTKNNSDLISFCEILNQNTSVKVAQACNLNLDNSPVYINSTYVGASTCIAYIISSLTINRLGKNNSLSGLAIISGLCISSVFFAPDITIAIILICIHIACGCVCIDVSISVSIDLFPTHLRTTALSLVLIAARVGSALGNLGFPYLYEAGCAPAFFSLGSVLILTGILSRFLPNTDLKALQ